MPPRGKTAEPPWTEAAGETRWLIYDLQSERIIQETTEIVDLIRCTFETPRHCVIEQATQTKTQTLRRKNRRAGSEGGDLGGGLREVGERNGKGSILFGTTIAEILDACRRVSQVR